ncbi:hypothetical protein NQ314_009531 [Rhamnusium bicolor]|uniref:Uncharacterized protein n=1 Tax=Rhamnusium bicolor TaxID=1586634 RepID=A0AAV8Y066_9CUCU|nr:hypothetical protein NQ314_009531 [Rhamnusium bicolor]
MALPKSRENPVIMKLDSVEFKSIFSEELAVLVSLFKEYGYEIRIAGGAVRDLLIGKRPTDLDFATTATPSQMKDMFTAEKIRMININGEKHGTITPRINDKANFEVTTLRIDIVTDGRHAEVQFTTDWMLDALRRDLTINSIFYGKIAKEANKHEKDTLKAIYDNRVGLEHISGERIWVELKKILEGNFAGDLMITIVENGLAPYLVFNLSGHLKLHAITLVSTLLNNYDDAIALNARLKLSAFERDLALFIVENREQKIHPKPLMPFQQLVLKSTSKPLETKKMAIEVLKYNNSPYLEEFENWDIPKFPVSGNMLKESGVESGRFMGAIMFELKHYWADNDFNISVEELLKQVPQIVNELNERKKRK